MCGGLAQVNVLLSTLMGGLSGSNIADAAMEAKLLVPEMEKAGYSKAFSSCLDSYIGYYNTFDSTRNCDDFIWVYCTGINW